MKLLILTVIAIPIFTLTYVHLMEDLQLKKPAAPYPIITYKGIPATVEEGIPISNGTFTKEGAPIQRLPTATPNKFRVTVDSKGRIVKPEDGIRVIGTLPLEDYRTIVSQVATGSPTPIERLVTINTNEAGNITATYLRDSMGGPMGPRTVDSIRVISSNEIHVTTSSGLSGQNLEFTKEDGAWGFIIVANWIH